MVIAGPIFRGCPSREGTVQLRVAMPSNDHTSDTTHISPWIPLSMVSSHLIRFSFLTSLQLAVTTTALALPLAFLRRQQRAANPIIGGDGRTSSLLTSTSKLKSSPPVRRRAPPPLPHRGGIPVPSAIPLSSRGTDGASAQTTPLAKAGSVFRAPSGEAPLGVSRVEKDGGFNGALYSLKAFGIATALVVSGAAAGAWSVKTYLGVKDVSGYV
jgi:hypothetical protein